MLYYPKLIVTLILQNFVKDIIMTDSTVKKAAYQTKQKKDLIRLFAQSPDRSLSAREIIEMGQGELSEATVFRLLRKLTEEGTLERTAGEGGVSFYRYCEDHCGCRFHLNCVGCGKLIHMDCSEMKEAERHIRVDHGFLPIGSVTVIDGLCRACQLKRAEEHHHA